ncbi:FAD-dependent monooxygenase [Chitinophaga sp. 22321]|uniref:FAD-dependent monooxygenase n=2 Tax=Chitinophaga hostae TaxID=2831022 RepID=A0ABS5J888_9BACT|nr:FAD-dependent monooxygenase [Chitinophaga hostae]MBS0031395.1 FAD-dependent monooxygenase [Chitinophaga hostae]
MESLKANKVLVSGASIAGLSTAYWMNKSGYQVTVVEIADVPRMGGTAVDFRGTAIDIVKRMGIFEQLTSNALNLEMIEFKNADDITENSIRIKKDAASGDEIEIERTALINILFNEIKNDVTFIFNDSITALTETGDDIKATFKNGCSKSFDLVIGCDGTHSNVRKICFGAETAYTHFLKAYFSISIINKSLIPPNTMQFYNVPGKAYMLNAYKHKTDIVFCFLSEKEIPYDYRDMRQQKDIILDQFVGQGWRTEELLEEVAHSENFYFDKFCQIKMPSWTKGRVALVGDAAYCASPAAGMGGSLAIEGAAALADALKQHNGNFELAFPEYNKKLRPLIEAVQAEAEFNAREHFIPATEEAIRRRNAAGF